MAEEKGREWKSDISHHFPIYSRMQAWMPCKQTPYKSTTVDPGGSCRYTDYIPPRNILGGTSKRGTLCFNFIILYPVSKRWIDRWTWCAHWRRSLRLRGLGFFLVSQKASKWSKMIGKVTGQGTNHILYTCVRSLALFQNIFLMTMMQPGWWMHIDEREEARVQECKRELASSSAFIWPRINRIQEFFFCSVSQPSTGIQSILYPFVGIGRKQRKKELEEHHSDPAVLPMAFKYLMYEHYNGGCHLHMQVYMYCTHLSRLDLEFRHVLTCQCFYRNLWMNSFFLKVVFLNIFLLLFPQLRQDPRDILQGFRLWQSVLPEQWGSIWRTSFMCRRPITLEGATSPIRLVVHGTLDILSCDNFGVQYVRVFLIISGFY